MTLIVDTSVAIKWAVAEECSDLAAPLFGGDVVAPDLLRSELANALWKKVVRKEIESLQASAAFAEIEAVLPFVSTDALGSRALAIALEIGHPVYDCVYLAMAEASAMRILTADTKLIRRCGGTPYGPLLVGLDAAP